MDAASEPRTLPPTGSGPPAAVRLGRPRVLRGPN
ncbi:MAG: hypothetical protein AVDCRST_MAG73-814, partial [uncultured Thermomicrobiales bacterium]